MKYSAIKVKIKLGNIFNATLTMIAIFVFGILANAQTSFVQQAKLTAADGAAQDSHGYSVAISGDTAVVGAPRNSGGTGFQTRGSVYVYVRSGAAGAWTFQQKLTPSDGAATDQFGYAVAISGNTIAVGRYNTTTGQNRGDGKVYIFTRTGSAWTETQALVSSDIAQGDLFGNSLAFENDTLVVGALNKNNGANFFQGAVYVFTRTGGAGNFTQQAKLTSSDGVFADFFGYSVAISGDSVIVGAPSLAGQPNSKGKAYVFTRSGSSWTEQSILQAADGTNGDAFGFAVGISNETAIVGARLDDVGATGDQGSAYVFARSSSAWSQTQQLFGTEATQRNDTFGGSVAIRGDVIAIGAPAHEIVSGIANHGAVYVFQRSGGGGLFGRTEKLVHNDTAPDALGTSVAFDGDSIISGAPSKDSARGAAYVFKTVSNGGQFRVQPADLFSNASWGTQLGLSEDTMAVGSNFGTNIYTRRGAAWEFTQRLALFTESGGATVIIPSAGMVFTGGMMIVGAPGARINNVGRGAVLVYRRNASGLWTEVQRLLASDGAANDQFGSSLAVSGNTLAVGAENKTVGGNATQGAAYVFTFDGTTWTEQQRLTAADGAAGDGFGRETAISGETIVVGAPGKTVGANSMEGAAYVFRRSGTVWSQQQRLVSSDSGFASRFGTSLAIEGDVIVAGAYQQTVGSNNFQGAAYFFTRSGNVWSEQQRISDPNGEGNDNFAIDLAMSGDKLYIGASGVERDGWANLGAVYVYARSGNAWQKRGRVHPFDRNRSKEFGYKVAIAGNYLATTAISDVNYDVSNSGSAYVLDTTRLRFASPESDFDGDGKADLSVFRPSERNWYLLNSTSGFGAVQFGLAADKLVPADFDGDGKTDIAVWREGASGRFYILQSSNGAVREEDFGIAGDNPALTGDWDGDGKADVAVYRASTNHFYYRGSANNPSGNITYLPWGAANDKPVRGDFDGDGKQDAAVFRPSNGTWYILQSSNGQARYENWGLSTDKFVPADYDGDGKTDLAVFRNGVWYIKQSSDGAARYVSFGLSNDYLAPADYDGDGKAETAVFRSGVWYIPQSSDAQIVYRNFGAAGDVPVMSAFVQSN